MKYDLSLDCGTVPPKAAPPEPIPVTIEVRKYGNDIVIKLVNTVTKKGKVLCRVYRQGAVYGYFSPSVSYTVCSSIAKLMSETTEPA